MSRQRRLAAAQWQAQQAQQVQQVQWATFAALANQVVQPPAQAESAAGGPPPGYVIERLRESAEHRDQGTLTEDEFAAQKAKILGQS